MQLNKKSKGVYFCFILFTTNLCAYATTIISSKNFANGSFFPTLLQNNEYNAWSTFQILPGEPGYLQVIHTIPSWSDLSTFYSRSFFLNGTQSPSYDTRVETHAPVYSINAFNDGTIASILLDYNNDVANLGLQIYGFGEIVRWYEIDITLYNILNSTISNIITKTYDQTSLGVLFDNATSDNVGQHVFFQIFNSSAVTQWSEPIMIDDANPFYNYSAVAFSAFNNGSLAIIYNSYNRSAPKQSNFVLLLIDNQGSVLNNPVPLFNSTSNSVVDVIALDGVWVASVLVNSGTNSIADVRLLVSGNSSLIPVSNSSGFKAINPLYMTNYFNTSVLLVYRVSFQANSTVFWKSRIFNITSGQLLTEVILVQDGEILGQTVGSDNGLYVAILNTQSTQQIVSLGLVAYVASASTFLPCLFMMFLMISLIIFS